MHQPLFNAIYRAGRLAPGVMAANLLRPALGRSPRPGHLRARRRSIKRTWPRYLRALSDLKRMLISERAKHGPLVRIETSLFGFMGIQYADGSLRLKPTLPDEGRRAPLGKTLGRGPGDGARVPYRDRIAAKPQRTQRPAYPRLHRFDEGHKLEGQFKMLLPKSWRPRLAKT